MKSSLFQSAFVLLFVFKCLLAHTNHDILLDGKTAILLKLFDNPFKFYQHTPGNLSYQVQWQDRTGEWSAEKLLFSRLVPDQSQFEPQPKKGIVYNGTEFVTFYFNTTSPLTTSFRVLTLGNSDNVVLKASIVPFNNNETSGYRNIGVLNGEWNLVGELRVSYLVIRPIVKFNPDADQYSNTDKLKFIGHRGTGTGIRDDIPGNYFENTLAAFNFACSTGAEMIELDVQLSLDKVPIVNHNFILSTHSSKVVKPLLMIESLLGNLENLSLKNFPYKILHELGKSFRHEHNLFAKFETILENMTPSCGINVEIKYPQLFKGGHPENESPLELNEYLDRILEVLYQHSANRPIIISSFHADVCTMIQLKQNKYRVLLLTSGNTKIYEPYYDPRTTSVELGSAFIQSFYMKGLSLLVNDLEQEPNHVKYIRSRNLTLYVWGDNLTNKIQLRNLVKLGVNGFICNKLDLILSQ